MALSGWQRLVAGAPWFRGEGRYPIAACSEFIPPPRAGGKPYGLDVGAGFDPDDPWGWPVPEAEEHLEVRPGLEAGGGHLVRALRELGRGRPVRGLGRHKLADNPAWPPELASARGLSHERYVVLLPLALSRTQDDKGRVRWTLFGGSEQGPARAFWRGFFTTPRRQA